MKPVQRWAGAQVGLSASAKSILNILAAMSDQAGTCFPSVRYLASMSSMSERSVQRCLACLKARGLIEIKTRRSSSGGQSSNLFRILAGDALKSTPTKPASTTPPAASYDTRPGDAPVTHNKGFTKIGIPNQQDAAGKDSDGCALEFPDGLSSAEKASARVVLKSVDQTAAQVLLDEIGGRMRVQPPVKNVIGYLRTLVKRMDEGVFAAEHALEEAGRRARANRRVAESALATAPRESGPPRPEVRAKLEAARAALVARARST